LILGQSCVNTTLAVINLAQQIVSGGIGRLTLENPGKQGSSFIIFMSHIKLIGPTNYGLAVGKRRLPT
jgi:hypothetical protein